MQSISIKILQDLSDGVFCYSADENRGFSYIGQNFLELTGYTEAELRMHTENCFANIICPEDRERVLLELSCPADSLSPESAGCTSNYQIAAHDGPLWVHHEQQLISDSKGAQWYLCILTDITDEARNETAEKLIISCVRQLSSSADFEDVMKLVLSSILQFYNGARAYIFDFNWETGTTSNTHEVCAPGVTPEITNLQNLPLLTVDPWIHVFERGNDVFVIEDVESLADDPFRQNEYETLKSQGIKALIAVPIRYDGGLHGFLGVDDPRQNTDDSQFLVNLTYFICNEIDKRKLNDELRKLSFSDFLTQFNNRNAYNAYLNDFNQAPVQNVGILFADLNSLKYMNDTLGHEYGDKLIRHMSDILKKYFPPHTTFRISGDEFVVIYAGCPYPQFQNAVTLLREELNAQTEELASIGFLWEQEPSDLRLMIYNAEQLMYKNKQEYHLSNEAADKQNSELLSLFLKNFQNDSFVFYLQPQTDIKTGALIGAEALARRITPTGEVYLPYDFIALLEKEHFISRLDFHIFREVCSRIQQWHANGFSLIPIAVNFSSITLSENDFVPHILDICQEYHVEPDMIIIEISRSGNRLDRARLRELIGRLKNSGIKIRVKNLTMENDFPAMMTLDGIHSVKLDISLIREMEDHYRTQLLVQTFIDLCHRLGQQCMACGVETQRQAALLSSMNCDSMQGFYLGRPVPPEQFEAQFLSGKSNPGIPASAKGTAPAENFALPDTVKAFDSSVFELLSNTTDNMYIYLANLKNDFSRWSPAAVKYFGLPGEYITNTAQTWAEYIHPDDRHIFMEDMGRIFKGESNRHCCEYRARNAGGEYVWVQCSGLALRDENNAPNLFAGTMINLKSASKYDLVTGLLSPYEYQTQFQQMLEKGENGALLLFGIDHFKRVNDIQGYQTGDQILRYLGQQVQLIPDCTFYRMDGDKFACVIKYGTEQDSRIIYNEFCKILKNVPSLSGTEFQLTASCGTVFFPQHGTQLEILRANAEYALEQAKKSYRGTMAFYSEDLHRKSLLSFRLQEVLHMAINNKFEGFSLNFQPLIHTQTGELFGAEALLRFSSPLLPPVYPDEFIPVLEETGAINEVGEWVLKTALRYASRWRKVYPDFRVTVNASYVQMSHKEFRDTVIRGLKFYDLPPEALILELTESCKVTDPEQLKSDFQYFVSHRIEVALDDFGTGYSSISMLRELSPTWIKIDHTFVASLSENRIDRAIIEYILELCRHADIRVCIEGVETAEVLQIVRGYQPDILQGYYFSKPLPVNEFETKYIQKTRKED